MLDLITYWFLIEDLCRTSMWDVGTSITKSIYMWCYIRRNKGGLQIEYVVN